MLKKGTRQLYNDVPNTTNKTFILINKLGIIVHSNFVTPSHLFKSGALFPI